MTTISRNTPCSCGSGKKFKLCCMPRDGATTPRDENSDDLEAPPTARMPAQTVRSNAFTRLMAFTGRLDIAAVLEGAFVEMWGEPYRQLPDDEQKEALDRPEAVAGVVTYCVLDAPTKRGKTIVEQYLAKHAKHAPPAEVAYLRQLATTRMGLYRIDDVRPDQGFRCLDLWTDQPIKIQEEGLTHRVHVGDVIGARAFPAADGATELDGAIYVFSESEARDAVALLRAEWSAAIEREPKLDEHAFLKRRFAVLIHQYWFEHKFFGVAEPPPDSFGVGMAEPHDRRSDLQYFRFDDADLAELAAFLHSPLAPTAMSIDHLHGFLCAVNCAPQLIRPQQWLPEIGGDEPMQIQSQAHSERIIASLFGLSNEIVDQLAEGTFAPLLPSRPVAAGMANVAQRWCAGFVDGMRLQQRSWDKLMKDESAYELIMPILALVDPEGVLEGGADTNVIAKFVAILPIAVKGIRAYWDDVAEKRQVARTRRARTTKPEPLTTKGGRAPIGRQGGRPASPTVHRLTITLNGIRPAIWRRLDIASDAKLPFVSQVLIAAMGWNDTHLHAFRAGSVTYGDPDPDFPTDMRSERRVTLAQLAPSAKDRFFFDYDFGDGWEHTVVVESVDVADAGATPRCVGGERACPPDDCGGVPGYRELCRILANPKHRRYSELRRWAGDAFDPEAFDLDEVNIKLPRRARAGRAGVAT